MITLRAAKPYRFGCGGKLLGGIWAIALGHPGYTMLKIGGIQNGIVTLKKVLFSLNKVFVLHGDNSYLHRS